MISLNKGFLAKRTMKEFLFLFFYVLFYTAIFAQEPAERPTISDRNPNNKLLNYNMDIPKGINGEQFIHGIAYIPIAENFALRLERLYTKFGTEEQVSAGVALKYFLREDFYLITGAEQQYNLQGITGKPQMEMTRLNFGVGQQVKPNLLLEVGYKPRLGPPPITGLQGPIINSLNSFFLKAKF